MLLMLTQCLPLVARCGAQAWLSRCGHSQSGWERLPEGLSAQQDKNSSPLGRHSSAASVVMETRLLENFIHERT